jgi:hypothetical protein
MGLSAGERPHAAYKTRAAERAAVTVSRLIACASLAWAATQVGYWLLEASPIQPDPQEPWSVGQQTCIRSGDTRLPLAGLCPRDQRDL